MKLLFRCSAWICLVFFTWLITRNSLSYFSDARSNGFVLEKGGLADNSFWLGALVIHVAAGIVCLAASFLQFFRPLLRRAPWLHRWLGRVYVGSILIFASPTGFYLAFYAHGGLAGTIGFLLLGILTAGTTWKGWIAMRRRNMAEHIAWMIRSIAMVTSAITFRIEYIALQLLGMEPETAFLAALYLSIAGNALTAEHIVRKIKQNKKKNKTRTTIHNEDHSPIPLHPRHS